MRKRKKKIVYSTDKYRPLYAGYTIKKTKNNKDEKNK